MAVNQLKVSDKWQELCRNKTWPDILEETALRVPDKEALIFQDRRVTYGEYWDKTKQFAKGLHALGVKPGAPVALWMTNRLEWPYCRFGTLKIGAKQILINTRFKTGDLEYVLSHSDAKFLIMEENFFGDINAMGMLKQLCPELETSEPGRLNLARFPKLKAIVCLGSRKQPGGFSLEEMLEIGENVSDEEIKAQLHPDDTCHIIYTSGTTGFPKGVVTPYSINIAFCAISTELFHLDQKSRYLGLVPFFGNIGLWNLQLPMIVGCTLIIADRYSPEDALKFIEKEKITHTILVPTMLVDVLSHPNFAKYDTKSLKHVVSGGAAIPAALIRDAKEKLGIDIMNAYGQVEASGLCLWVPEGETAEHIQYTIGLPMPHGEVTIRDPKTNNELPVNQEGEICTREVFPGSQHMKGYYKDPKLTAETIIDGWLHSGDLGKKDEDGYFRLTGRVKEMYIVGGFNVSPVEVENELLQYPIVEQVAVVGVPDKRLGEVGAAFIRVKPGKTITEKEIIAYSKEKMTNIKVPRYVAFVKDFPINPQGKIQKFKLREQAVKIWHLED